MHSIYVHNVAEGVYKPYGAILNYDLIEVEYDHEWPLLNKIRAKIKFTKKNKSSECENYIYNYHQRLWCNIEIIDI